jgi:hypothetical protein
VLNEWTVRGLLSAFLLVHVVAHLLCAWVCYTEKAAWMLRTTAFTRRNRAFSVGAHLVCGILWLIVALIVLIRNGDNDDDDDSRWGGPDPHGVLVGTLWLFDAGIAALLVNTLATRRPQAFFRPLSASALANGDGGEVGVTHPPISTTELRALIASALLTAAGAVCGIAMLALSMAPSALHVVFGTAGAPLMLGVTLILHVPPLTLLTFVHGLRRPVHVLQPLSARGERQLALVFAALAIVCCALGAKLLADYTDEHECAAPPRTPRFSTLIVRGRVTLLTLDHVRV